MPLLRKNWKRKIPARQKPVGHNRNLDWRWIANGLSEQPDLIVEIDRRAQASIPPCRVARAAPHRRPRLSLSYKAAMHCRADEIDSNRNERIDVVVAWIAERRSEHDSARGSRLVVVVHDLRMPGAEQDAVDCLRLGLRRHVGVAVVVVTGILLIKPGDTRGRAFRGDGLAHVPVRDEIHPIGIDQSGEEDVIAQEPHRLGIVPAHHLVHELNELLGAEYFSGVQPAIDPYDRLPLLRKSARFFYAHALRQSEPSRYLAIAVESPVVLRRCDDGHDDRPALGACTDTHYTKPVRFTIQLRPVLQELLVVREVIIVADVESEFLAGAGDSALGGRKRRDSGENAG